jgi:DNA mismatch repair protein MutH
MQRMNEEFGVSNFTISVWRVADELVENPERDNKRRIKNDKYEEVIDMIVAFLVKAIFGEKSRQKNR